MTSKTLKPKREPKYKTQIRVNDNGSLFGSCSCGWKQPVAAAQSAGLALAMAAVQSEIQAHKHIPKVKKVKT